MPPVNTVKGPKYNSCPDSSPCAKNAVEIIENNNQFVWVEEKARWFSPDGKRQIWFEDGWKYDGGSGVIEEFTIINKYSDAVGTTPTVGNKSFMQGHHGIQSQWAITNLGEEFYNPKEAPVILLRDSCKGTPHEKLTSRQANRDKYISYFQERENFIDDCAELKIPSKIRDEYLKKADEFYKKIYLQMRNTNKYSESELWDIFQYDFGF